MQLLPREAIRNVKTAHGSHGMMRWAGRACSDTFALDRIVLAIVTWLAQARYVRQTRWADAILHYRDRHKPRVQFIETI